MRDLPTLDAELFVQAEMLLGEGPFWHDHRLYWVDIVRCALHSCDGVGRDHRVLTLPSPVGAVAPWPGGFIAGTEQGIGVLATDGSFALLPKSPQLAPGIRFNDGKRDPAGRFWCGTMDGDDAPEAGSLYRVDQNGDVAVMLDRITIANGLAWDTSRRTFYYIDSLTRRVDRFDYDPASGAISNRSPALVFPEALGLPDGMTRDESGRLWIAFWEGAQVIGFDPRSTAPVCRINVPASLATSCCLHSDGRTLFITTARFGLSDEQLRQQPLAGSIFRVELPTP